MFIPKNIHRSWQAFLTPEIRAEIKNIENQIGADFNPTDPQVVLRFLTTDLTKVKVIWLGQDVYPAEGVATGRAFEVGGLDSWLLSFRQVSLKNIVRLLYKDYNGITDYEDIKTYANIKPEIAAGTFKIIPPAEWYQSLENQGVLFLNTSFTCKIGEPNSHKALWEKFSQAVLAYISAQRPNAIWFLWGNEAQSNIPYIEVGIFYESRHPARVSAAYPNDFLKFTGFKKTMDQINWLG